jgi:hypothetical protein
LYGTALINIMQLLDTKHVVNNTIGSNLHNYEI